MNVFVETQHLIRYFRGGKLVFNIRHNWKPVLSCDNNICACGEHFLTNKGIWIALS